jgi:hypothetical protein
MTTPEISSLFATARITDRAAAAAREAIVHAMLQAMRNLLAPDTVIKLDARPLPEYLLNVHTMSGNDRGTKSFRIVKVTHVNACPYAPELSNWSATAVPISEKTGKDMSGATHGVASGATVTLHGDLVCTMLDDITETSALDRLMSLVAKHAAPAPAAQAA